MSRYISWQLIAFIVIVVVLSQCTFPFTTATYKWKIKYDKEKLAFKEEFLSQELAEYSKDRPPNILFIVVDDLGKYEVSAYGSETMHTPNIDQLPMRVFVLKIVMSILRYVPHHEQD